MSIIVQPKTRSPQVTAKDRYVERAALPLHLQVAFIIFSYCNNELRLMTDMCWHIKELAQSHGISIVTAY
jgi:hypothetical protein